MKKLTLFVLLFSLFACNGDAHQEHGQMKSLAKNSEGKGDNPLSNVLSSYELLHEAFYQNNANQVYEMAEKVATDISSLSNPELKEMLSHSKEKLESIKADRPMEENKKNFDVASRGIIHAMKKQGGAKDYDSYYCPMVKKYWIQNVAKMEKVHNPYASDSMPHCGSRESM